MSHNLLQNLIGIGQCINLQFVNISYNMITDISPLSNLHNMQELYFSHNLISSVLVNFQEYNFEIGWNSNTTIWPALEVMDLTHNKLNDFDEI